VPLGAWTNTLNIDTILTLIVVIAAGWFAIKGKQAANADQRAEQAREDADSFRDNYTAERARSQSLEERLTAEREAKHAALTENARLKMLTDLTNVLKAIADFRAETAAHFEAFGKALDKFHETQAEQTSVLQAIEKRLTRPS
jgi:hypothetical protein